jgi:hypothetical protein
MTKNVIVENDEMAAQKTDGFIFIFSLDDTAARLAIWG